MGNNISRILKDPFFAFEELLKNEVLLSGGTMRFFFHWGTKRICSGVHSIKKALLYSEALALLQAGMWWKNIF